MIDSPYLVKPGKKWKLSDVSPADIGRFKDKAQALPIIRANIDQLRQLQDLLYADGRWSVLIVLQAMDTAGKDGAIKHVFSGVNPQGCSVVSFKVPTHLEAAHDFLWRIHEAAPPRGMIGIFNRSHYESVLVERVRKLVPREVWAGRYERINGFERLLADEHTLILKFFLHISKDEQKKRLQKRQSDKHKHWKFNPGDLEDRALWDQYMEAYQDAICKCSTEQAPWFVVPANHKWFRNWLISDTIVRAMQTLKLRYPSPVEGIEKIKIK